MITTDVRRATSTTEVCQRTRRALIVTFGSLLGLSLAFDYSIYVGGLTHIYVHDIATLAAGSIGLYTAWRRSAALPDIRLLRLPLILFTFLIINCATLGVVHFGTVPTAMHKLFWFEHGDAIRIVGELLIWTWAMGQLSPDETETWRILDLAAWGGAVNAFATAAYWLAMNTPDTATTPFDLTIMVGLPISLVLLWRRRFHVSDMVRVAIFAGAGVLLYSRTSIVTLAITAIAVLVSFRNWGMIVRAATPIVVGAAVVVALPFALAYLSTAGAYRTTALPTPGNPTVPVPTAGAPGPIATPPAKAPHASVPPPSALRRAISIGDVGLASYTVPNRLAIWRDAVRIFAKSPVFGVGYHDYFIYSHVTEIKDASRFDPPDLFSSLIKQAHNDFLSWLAETGVVGLLFYLAFWLLMFRAAWQGYRAHPSGRPEHTLGLALVVGLFIVSWFGEILIPRTPSWIAPAVVWWIIFATVLATAEKRHLGVLPRLHL